MVIPNLEEDPDELSEAQEIKQIELKINVKELKEEHEDLITGK